jgi:hypothetical protein
MTRIIPFVILAWNVSFFKTKLVWYFNSLSNVFPPCLMTYRLAPIGWRVGRPRAVAAKRAILDFQLTIVIYLWHFGIYWSWPGRLWHWFRNSFSLSVFVDDEITEVVDINKLSSFKSADLRNHMSIWQGVAIDSLKYLWGLACSTTLRCMGDHPCNNLMQGRRPAAVFYPLGHPTPYASAWITSESDWGETSKWKNCTIIPYSLIKTVWIGTVITKDLYFWCLTDALHVLF